MFQELIESVVLVRQDEDRSATAAFQQGMDNLDANESFAGSWFLNKQLVRSTQCDQIGRFIGLWATF